MGTIEEGGEYKVMQKYVQDKNNAAPDASGGNRVRMVLLPGLAADERMYARVREALEMVPLDISFELVTPRLLVPNKKEKMEEYARRTAEALHIQAHDIVGGCSFGSMVASAVAAHIPVQGLVLLSGALDSSALVHSSRILNRIAPIIPFPLLQRVLASDWFLRSIFGAANPADIELGRSMLLDTPEKTLRRGGFLAATCELTKSLTIPIHALHGADDRVIRSPHEVDHCKLVPHAGHGMVVSHPHEVAEFLLQTVQEIIRAES